MVFCDFVRFGMSETEYHQTRQQSRNKKSACICYCFGAAFLISIMIVACVASGFLFWAYMNEYNERDCLSNHYFNRYQYSSMLSTTTSKTSNTSENSNGKSNSNSNSNNKDEFRADGRLLKDILNNGIIFPIFQDSMLNDWNFYILTTTNETVARGQALLTQQSDNTDDNTQTTRKPLNQTTTSVTTTDNGIIGNDGDSESQYLIPLFYDSIDYSDIISFVPNDARLKYIEYWWIVAYKDKNDNHNNNDEGDENENSNSNSMTFDECIQMSFENITSNGDYYNYMQHYGYISLSNENRYFLNLSKQTQYWYFTFEIIFTLFLTILLIYNGIKYCLQPDIVISHLSWGIVMFGWLFYFITIQIFLFQFNDLLSSNSVKLSNFDANDDNNNKDGINHLTFLIGNWNDYVTIIWYHINSALTILFVYFLGLSFIYTMTVICVCSKYPCSYLLCESWHSPVCSLFYIISIMFGNNYNNFKHNHTRAVHKSRMIIAFWIVLFLFSLMMFIIGIICIITLYNGETMIDKKTQNYNLNEYIHCWWFYIVAWICIYCFGLTQFWDWMFQSCNICYNYIERHPCYKYICCLCCTCCSCCQDYSFDCDCIELKCSGGCCTRQN